MSILWEAFPTTENNVRLALGGDIQVVESGAAALRRLEDDPAERLLVVGPDVELTAVLDVAEKLRLGRPEVGIILMRRRLDVTVLAQALRSGIREVVGASDLSSLTQAGQRSRELSDRLNGLTGGTMAPEGRVVTVFAAKGGVGKTTVSINLAAELATGGASVLLVDLDLAFGDVAISLALMPERSCIDLVAMSGHLDAQGLASVVTAHESGLDALCAPVHPGDAERISATLVTELLRVARRIYDFVIIDTPPAFTEHVLVAFDASDVTILLGTLDIPAIKNLKLALNTLDQLGTRRESLVVVLNRANAKAGLSASDVTATLGCPIAVQIPSSVAVPAATNRGEAIVITEPRHPVSVALKTLAREYVLGPGPAAAPGVETSQPDSRAGRAADHPQGRRLFRRSQA
jgi:pilus assembly protein CpaE